MRVVICRGLPGSGKSTLAANIKAGTADSAYVLKDRPAELFEMYDGVIVSSDEYFTVGGVYYFDAAQLFKAHSWNQWRFYQLVNAGKNVIVDNTNTTWKEIEPYANMAHDRGYTIHVVQPTTPWAFDIDGLMAHGTHNVPRETYEKMLARFENIESIREKIGKL